MSNCQQCFQPLQIQQLFPQKNLQESYDVLAQEMVQEGEHDVQGSILEQDAIFFGQADDIASSDFSSTTMLALRIKDFADQSNIQLKHPICFECFDEILKQQEYKVKSQERERDMYRKELENIEQAIAQSSQTDEELVKELEKLEKEEEELDKKLDSLNRDEETQQKMLEYLQLSKEKIESQEESIWKRVNDYEREHCQQLDQSKQIDSQIMNLDKLYKRLRKTNFLNEVFHISCQDQFGTISGFRLGRIVQLIDIGWDEVNTALGQSAYLMALIAHRFGYKFDQYKINLCGSMTTIQLKYVQQSNKNQKYELYYGVSEERFNTALEYLLDCLNGLIQDVAAKTSALSTNEERKAPIYAISGNTIGNLSIRWKSSDSQTWTAAMKYFLTNLQWLIYKSQQKDLADQRENLNMENNSSNFTIAGL